MRHLRTRGDAYAFCSDYEKTTTRTTHSYRNVRCLTDNGGQLVGSFQQYPDCFTLRDLFNRIVDNFSGYPVFGYENNGSVEWITYSEFSVLVLNFAYAMKKMGIVPGQHVAVFIESSTWFALSQWALAYLGAVMVPIKDNEDKTVIPQIIKVLKSHVLICSERTVGRLSGIINEKTRLRTIIVACDGRVGDQVLQQAAHAVRDFPIDIRMLPQLLQEASQKKRKSFPPLLATSTAVINFGAANGGVLNPAALSHSNLIAAAAGITSCGYRFGREVYLSSLSMYHPFERSMQLLIMAHGGSVGFMDRSRIQAMQLIEPTVAAFTGAEFEDIASEVIRQVTSSNWLKRFFYDIALSIAAQSVEYDTQPPWFFNPLVVKPFKQNLGGRVRLLISTVSALQPRVQHLLRIALQIPVIQVYGTAETGGVIAIQHINDKGVDVVGGPCCTCEVKVRDFSEGKTRVARSEPGELLVRGTNVFKGYQNNKSTTKRVMSDDGWFATGDLVKLKANGTLEITDTITKVQARRVALNKVVTPKLSFV